VKSIDDGLLLSIEDGLRATARDLAQAIPDDSVPPLPPPSRQADRHAARPSLGQRIRRLFAPLTAATAIVTAVVSPPAIAHEVALLAAGHHGAVLRASASSSDIPAYYVLVPQPGRRVQRGGDALIRSTVSGRTLAVVTPRPHYTFVSVTGGAASDRTFVLGGRDQATGTTRPFVLTFAVRKNGLISFKVKPLPFSFTPGSLLSLSPDGARLALARTPGTGLTIVDLATGKSQTWTTAKSMWSVLSWNSDSQTLQYCRRNDGGQDYYCGTVGTNAAGTIKAAAGEQALRSAPDLRIIGVTPSGVLLDYRFDRAITEISLRAFDLVGNLGRIGQDSALLWGTVGVLWTNPSGSVLIVGISPGRSSPPTPVVLADSEFWRPPGDFASAQSFAW
jgi:hypothetical protein